MTHADVFRLHSPGAPRDPVPGCMGALSLVGRYWGPLNGPIRYREVRLCQRCHALIGLLGDTPVFAARAGPG